MRLAILIAFATAAAATGARADGPAPARTVADLEASGGRHFELAEYDQAIADFKEAFRLSDAPRFLFNLGQAYRLSGDCKQALTLYRTYLRREPSAVNAEQVKRRIGEMETCVATTPAAAPARDPVVSPRASRSDVTPPRHSRTWRTWAGLGAVGAGAIAGGLGVVFAGRGAAAERNLLDACAVSCTSADARAIERRGDAANRDATISFVVAGVAVGAGVALIVLDRLRGGERAGPIITPTRGGAAASWTWRF